jgi:hypothetical protein
LYLFEAVYDYIILLLEGLTVRPKLFRGPLVDHDRRVAQGWCRIFDTCDNNNNKNRTRLQTETLYTYCNKSANFRATQSVRKIFRYTRAGATNTLHVVVTAAVARFIFETDLSHVS